LGTGAFPYCFRSFVLRGDVCRHRADVEVKICKPRSAGGGETGKIDGTLAFSGIAIFPTLVLGANGDHDLATRLLKKAEQGCLIARSLACPVTMEAIVRTEELVPVPANLAGIWGPGSSATAQPQTAFDKFLMATAGTLVGLD
jgi:hypothetical protein